MNNHDNPQPCRTWRGAQATNHGRLDIDFVAAGLFVWSSEKLDLECDFLFDPLLGTLLFFEFETLFDVILMPTPWFDSNV